MASDWIKMRVWLRRDPKVIRMADVLSTNRLFMDWLTDPVHKTCNTSSYEHVTSNVTRALCVTTLLEIWGTAREQGSREGDDLVLTHCSVATLDDVADVPGIGEAMEAVGWVREDGDRIIFPSFFAEKATPEQRHRTSNAERQARYRRNKRNVTDNVTSDVTPTVTNNVEERREEEKKKDPQTPARVGSNNAAPPDGKPPTPRRFDEFWSAYPRKTDKAEAMKSWTKLKPDDATVDEILAAIAVLKRSDQWMRNVIPLPTTWLNRKRWLDDDARAPHTQPRRVFGDLPLPQQPKPNPSPIATEAQT